MVTLQQCVLAAGFAGLLSAADAPTGNRFRADDPLASEAAPRKVGKLEQRPINAAYDFLDQSFETPRQPAALTRAGDINTLGDVLDGAWYTRRHYFNRMSIDELKRGPGNSHPPQGMLVIIGAKSDGVTPGFTVRDETGREYLLKFDPPAYPELASGADVIGSKILYALGYNTPENYVLRFRPERLVIGHGAVYRTRDGHVQALTLTHIRRLLRAQPRDRDGEYRALASRWVPGEAIGAFKYWGTRSDDPNDIIDHQDRRVLRGLAVFAAWINHTDAKAINSMDAIVEEGGHRFIRHYLIDFGSSLGSDSLGPKNASRGHVYEIEPHDILRQAATLGLRAPIWQRVSTPHLVGAGRFEATSFEPRHWKSNYPNPAFLRLTEDDAFWAARQVAAFTNDDIRAMVSTAEFTDPRTTEYITQVLAARRDKIIQAYLEDRLAIDRFRVDQEKLEFDELRWHGSHNYQIAWSGYDNESGLMQRWNGSTGPQLPQLALHLNDGSYCAATITEPGLSGDQRVHIYLRRTSSAWTVVGIERNMATPEVLSARSK